MRILASPHPRSNNTSSCWRDKSSSDRCWARVLVGLKGARLLSSSVTLALLVLVVSLVLSSGCLVVFGWDGGGDVGGVNVFNLVDMDAIISVILEVEVMDDS